MGPSTDPDPDPQSGNAAALAGEGPPTVRLDGRPGQRDGATILRDGDVFTITLDNGVSLVEVGEAGHGRVTRRGRRTLIYRPDPDHVGEDRFTYTVEDKDGRRLPATVTLSVESVEDETPPSIDAPPLPTDSESVAAEPESESGPETEPETETAGNETVELSVSDDIFGKLELSESGGLVYTPPKGFVGIDRFRFRLRGQDGRVRSGVVTAWVDSDGKAEFLIDEDRPGDDKRRRRR